MQEGIIRKKQCKSSDPSSFPKKIFDFAEILLKSPLSFEAASFCLLSLSHLSYWTWSRKSLEKWL